MRMDLVFEVLQEGDGGFTAECLTEPIFAEADSWDALRSQVQDAVSSYFFDRPKPAQVRLRLVRDEVLAVA